MPEPYKLKIKLDKLSEKGIEKIVHYTSNAIIHTVFWMYLFSKYKTKCFPIQRSLTILYNSNKDTPTDAQIRLMIFSAKAAVACINADSKIFIIPTGLYPVTDGITISTKGHANFLIYRRKYNHFEHFDPHGMEFDDGSHSVNINLLLTNFLEQVNTLLGNKHPPVTLVRSSEVCPSKNGFQGFEQDSSLFKHAYEGGGYCAAWSMFFTEL